MEPTCKIDLLLKNIFAALENSLEFYQQRISDPSTDRRGEYRDALIKRFEWSNDLLWIHVKIYLDKEHGIIASHSPKAICRDLHALGIINDQESQGLIKIVDARNLATEAYQEDIAEDLLKRIPGFFTLMSMVVGRMAPPTEP